MTKTKTIITWTVTSLLAVFLVLLGLIYVLPGYDLYLVRSGSMTPAILTGDLIITGPLNGPLSAPLKAGTVVTYQRGTDLVTHRIQSVNGNALVTKGDAVEKADPWTVTMSDVRGVFMFKIPLAGYLLNFTHSKLGWFMMIIIPGALLVLWLTRDILKEAFST